MVVDIKQQKVLWNDIPPNTYKIGIIIGYSATSNQLIQYIEDLNKYSAVNCIGIVLDEEMKLHQDWFDKNFSGIPFLSCSKKECEQLIALIAIILPESNVTFFEYIPASIIKSGLPHGTDIPIQSTLFSYGGGFYFDYILSAIKQPVLTPDKYENGFPAVMRLHKKPYVCLLPFGFPKLDKFFDVVTNIKRPKSAIVYHLSLLSIEEPWVIGAIFGTLKNLLVKFPDNKVIFRAHHLNHADPVITKSINMGRDYDNFYYSDADSYIGDYAEGAVMVTHREYYNHLFDLATASPTVLYKENNNYVMRYEHDERYYLASNENFINVVKQVLDMDFDTSIECRKQRCQSAGIYNPGESLDYLVDNLDHIIKGNILPEWTPYYLNEGSLEEVNYKLHQFILSKRTFGHFSLAYGAMTHYSAVSLLLLAESFIRYNFIEDYFYPHAMKYFYQLLHHDDFHLVSVEAEHWWKTKGLTGLALCLSAIDKGESSATPEVLWLSENYSATNERIEASQSFTIDELKIVNLKDGSNITSNEVILYGLGEYSERIITMNNKRKMFNILAVIDHDETQADSHFCNTPILQLDKLKGYTQDIIICSQVSLVAIVSFLTTKNKYCNELYGIIDDKNNDFLFNLIS